MMTNDELMTSFQIRSENYNEVQRLLNDINQILFRAQRLRGEFRDKMCVGSLLIYVLFSVGNVATKMMSSYKEALGQKNIEKLVQIMQI